MRASTVANCLGGAFNPNGARIQPAKLVRGLAEAVERLGVTIYEGTTVTEIQPKHAITTNGTVTADVDPARHRRLHRGTEGSTSRVVTDELVDDRHRSAAEAGMVRDRLGRLRDARRHGARVLLRATHRR